MCLVSWIFGVLFDMPTIFGNWYFILNKLLKINFEWERYLNLKRLRKTCLWWENANLHTRPPQSVIYASGASNFRILTGSFCLPDVRENILLCLPHAFDREREEISHVSENEHYSKGYKNSPESFLLVSCSRYLLVSFSFISNCPSIYGQIT